VFFATFSKRTFSLGFHSNFSNSNNMATERTYIMVKNVSMQPSLIKPQHQQVKPDGVERGLVGEIIKRFEQKGYKLLALELMHPTKELLEQHYGDLKTKSFFPKLVAYMLSGPVCGKASATFCISASH
jgi:hypothetical protein